MRHSTRLPTLATQSASRKSTTRLTIERLSMYAQSLPVFPLVPSWLIRLGSSIETHLLSGAGHAGSPLLQTTIWKLSYTSATWSLAIRVLYGCCLAACTQRMSLTTGFRWLPTRTRRTWPGCSRTVMACRGSCHVLSWLVAPVVTYCHGTRPCTLEAFPGTLEGYVCIHANAAVAVRSCVKPNEIKSSSKFNEMRVRHQVGNGDGA